MILEDNFKFRVRVNIFPGVTIKNTIFWDITLAVWEIFYNVSEENSASIFRAKEKVEKGSNCIDIRNDGPGPEI
jgi:hypothetical protein